VDNLAFTSFYFFLLKFRDDASPANADDTLSSSPDVGHHYGDRKIKAIVFNPNKTIFSTHLKPRTPKNQSYNM
jgi:hypothetical protein